MAYSKNQKKLPLKAKEARYAPKEKRGPNVLSTLTPLLMPTWQPLNIVKTLICKKKVRGKRVIMGKLKDWVNEDWVRIDSQGNIAGKCGTSKNKKNPDRCLPRSKAIVLASLKEGFDGS